MLTGLEIGGIVVGCVNAGLSAAKLVRDWYEKRKERKQESKNQKLEESLRLDASSINSAYQYHMGQIRKHDQRRFEVGDELSLAEINPTSRRLQSAMQDLRSKIKKSKAKVVPDMTRFISTSNDAQLAIVEALARLHKRIVYETRVPRSLNPLKMFGFGKNKQQKQQQQPTSPSTARLSLPPPPPSRRALPAPRASSGSSESADTPDPRTYNHTTSPFLPTAVPPPVFPQLPWDFDTSASIVHAPACPCANQAPECICARQQPRHQQVVYVDTMYVNNGNETHASGGKPRKSSKAKPKSKSKPVAMEIVLVRRPVRS